MQITVIVVTYSDRFHFLKQVLDSCFISGVQKAVVIDNNSHENSKNQLREYSKGFVGKIDIIWNDSNLGSAKAFKQGMKRAYELKNDFIWLLDDDNKPQHGSLDKLIQYWNNKPKGVVALLSYRPDRPQYKQAVIENNSDLVLSSKNSFSGFHLSDKIIKSFKNKKSKNLDVMHGPVAYAPYGGMFFRKSILDKIGYPDETFFLYSDDHEWSYRITKLNKKIYLVLDSLLEDIDTSWAVKDDHSNTFEKIKKAPPLRVYYTIRNRILFEKKYLISNKIVYKFNQLLFTILLGVYAFRSSNFKVFLRAMRDAKNNNLVKF